MAASRHPLPAEYREGWLVFESANETLNEVCDVPAVEKLDTGELIRVEETLAIAAATAKQVVSLRRQRRTQVLEKEQPEHEAGD